MLYSGVFVLQRGALITKNYHVQDRSHFIEHNYRLSISIWGCF